MIETKFSLPVPFTAKRSERDTPFENFIRMKILRRTRSTRWTIHSTPDTNSQLTVTREATRARLGRRRRSWRSEFKAPFQRSLPLANVGRVARIEPTTYLSRLELMAKNPCSFLSVPVRRTWLRTRRRSCWW